LARKLIFVLLVLTVAFCNSYSQLRVPSLQVSDKLADTTFIFKTSVYTDTGLIWKRLKVGVFMVDSATGRDTGKVAIRDTVKAKFFTGRADTSSRTDSMKYGATYVPGAGYLRSDVPDTMSQDVITASGALLSVKYTSSSSPITLWYAGHFTAGKIGGGGVALYGKGTGYGGIFDPNIRVEDALDTLTISHATDTTKFNTTARAIKLNKNLYLDSTCWDDIRIAGSQLRNGATAPSFGVGTRLGGIYVLSFTGATGTDDIHTAIQLPHTWKPNTTIYAHVHGAAHAAITGAQDTISCGIEYAFLSLGDTLLTPANCTDTITGYWHITADSLRRHSMLNIGAITPTGFSGTSKKESSMLMIRLFRNTADVKDTYTGNFEIYEFDIHFQVHKMGTKNELSD
jgi:hypothetical protein